MSVFGPFAISSALPSAPRSLAVAAGTSLVLTWQAPTSSGSGSVANYKVYRGTSSGGETLLTTVGNVLTYTDSAVVGGTTYYYKVAAVTVIGTGPQSTEASATASGGATLPGAPTSLGVSSSSVLALSWLAPASSGTDPITNYAIYRGTTSGSETLLTLVGTGLTYTDSSGTPGDTYYYKVAAITVVGTGPQSNEASGTVATDQTDADWINPYTDSWVVPLSTWFPGGVVEAPNGPVVVATLASILSAAEYGCGVNTDPMCIVPAGQALVQMTGFANFPTNVPAVPIPPYAASLITDSNDSDLIIYQPSSGKSWELWEAYYTDGAWSTGDGALMTNMGTSNGALPHPYGISAAGLPYLGLNVSQADVLRGVIAHAVCLEIELNKEQVPFWPPATRNDGGASNYPNSGAEGMWFTWAPGTIKPTGMEPFASMIYDAIADYGLVITDVGGGGFYFKCESPASWAAQGGAGTDPITTSWGTHFQYNVMASGSANGIQGLIEAGALYQIVPPAMGASPGTGPGTPTGLTLTPGSASLAASWTAPSGSPVQYVVQYRLHTGPGAWAAVQPNPSTNSATITGLTSSTEYDVQVFAINAVTVGAGSSIVSGTPT